MTEPLLAVSLAVVATAAVITHNRITNRKVESDMGVVKNALNEINAQLHKVHDEFTGKLDELLAREHLDDEDRAAIEELRTTAQKLDDIVPDAVVEPLPDPETPPETGGEDPVVDPEDPVDPVDETPVDDAPATGDDGAADDELPVEDAPADDAPADAGTVGDVAPDTATEDGADDEGNA